MSEEIAEELPYLKKVTAKGRLYLYYQREGFRQKLHSGIGTPELRAEMAEAEKAYKMLAAPPETKPGTLAGVLELYRKSAEFKSNSAMVQKAYGAYLDEFIEDAGEVLLSEITRTWVIDMRDAWAERGYRAANLRLQCLKNALMPIILDEKDTRIDSDPFRKIANVRRPQSLGVAHLTWTNDEVRVAIDDAIARGRPGLARGIALGRWAGFRKGTICKVPLYARIWGYDEHQNKQRRLYWVTEKKLVLADMPEDALLTQLLDSTENRALTIAYNADGQPWKERQFSQALDRHMARLAAKGLVRAAVDEDTGEVYCPLDVHGLRHARGVELAEAGVPDSGIQAQLAQKTPKAAQIYRAQANAKRLADSAQTNVNNVRYLQLDKKPKMTA